MVAPHPPLSSSPSGAPSPLTIRDPWLGGQGAPFLALAELYQVFEAQHGAYAGSIPRVELGHTQQRSGVSLPEARVLWCPALKEANTVTDGQNREIRRDQEAHRLWSSRGDGASPGKAWGSFRGHSQLEGSQSMSGPEDASSSQGRVPPAHTEVPPTPR